MREIDNLIKYIITFMFGEQATQFISYSKKPVEDIPQSIIIRPSTFFDEEVFGKETSMPLLPLKEWHSIPILFGSPHEILEQGKLIVSADIIASAFFLLSRYEETINFKRDKYGRFQGKESIPYKANFIHRPIVDEYATMLSSIALKLGIALPHPQQKRFANIFLTHDIDIPWESFTFYEALKRIAGVFKRERRLDCFPLKNWMGHPESDPRYTFPDIIRLDSLISNKRVIFFFKSGGKHQPEDAFIYIDTKAVGRLYKRIKSSGALVGYHASFEAGQQPQLIKEELIRLRRTFGQNITLNRNHYLCSREPKDFYALIQNGIKEDYTMGYADVAGFRLGTSKAVRWISPYDGEVTSLILHPLTIMECSLSEVKYMNLNDIEMREYACELIDATYENGGELTLLWHNQSLMKCDRHRQLYEFLLKYIAEKETL